MSVLIAFVMVRSFSHCCVLCILNISTNDTNLYFPCIQKFTFPPIFCYFSFGG